MRLEYVAEFCDVQTARAEFYDHQSVGEGFHEGTPSCEICESEWTQLEALLKAVHDVG